VIRSSIKAALFNSSISILANLCNLDDLRPLINISSKKKAPRKAMLF